MKMKKKYQSEILGVLHEMAEDLHNIGAINDTRMAEYDQDCVTQVKTQATNPKKINIQPLTKVLASQKTASTP